MAEAHPVGFRWVMKAKENGATIIHVDPRFSRTSALADIWVPIRAGSDIAFLGGLVRHVLENNLFFRDYVVHYTNASCILRRDYRDAEDQATGFFSGWNEENRSYSSDTWAYEGDDLSRPKRDLSLQDPQCVFQKLKRHFARYTPEMVEKVCGIPPQLFQKVVDTFVRASGPEKTAAICYAVGWTQHSKGVQIIRTAAVLQLLLGNIGRPGGGILALRGHASIQGSTDIPASLRRQIVAYQTREAPGTIVIDTANTQLFFVLSGNKAIRYGVGVGRDGFTWSGTQTITRKTEWPDWVPPAEMLARQPYLPRFMAGGVSNPLGARAMYLGGTVYRIHGTNAPETIGGRVSSGCIRMLNEDVIDLYARTQIGTKVVVLPGKHRIGSATRAHDRLLPSVQAVPAAYSGMRTSALY